VPVGAIDVSPLVCAGCYDMSGGISGSSHVCLYTPEHCCQAGCEANGGYWIDGTGAQTCSSDPDCDDDDDRTPCGCDALTQCGDGTGATDVNGDGSIDLDCSDGNCDKLCVLGNCPEEEGALLQPRESAYWIAHLEQNVYQCCSSAKLTRRDMLRRC
jgi:hypothetical protein